MLTRWKSLVGALWCCSAFLLSSQIILAQTTKKTDFSKSFEKIISELEDEKFKSVEKLQDIYLNAENLDDRLAACLSLAVHYHETNPRLTQQYIGTALALKDPFQDDDYLAATATFFRVKYRFRQNGPDLVAELQQLSQNQHLPWKMLKTSLEMLLDHRWEKRDYAGYLKTFNRYKERMPRFAVEDRHLKRVGFILRSSEQTDDYLANLEILASRYPISPESKWAFEQLIAKTEPNQVQRYAFSLSFLRKVYLNSVIETESRDTILAQLEKPVRVFESQRPEKLSPYDKIRFLIRLKEYKKALAITKKEIDHTKSSHYQKFRAGLWQAHILGELGRHAEAISEYEARLAEDLKISPFFLESYAASLMKNGQYSKAAETYQKVRATRDHYRLRWYAFWNLIKSRDYKAAASLLKTHKKLFHKRYDSDDARRYWGYIIQHKNGEFLDNLTDKLFTGQRQYYYDSILRARLHLDNNIRRNQDHFKNLALGFDFNQFIQREAGSSPAMLADYENYPAHDHLNVAAAGSSLVRAALPTPDIKIANIKKGDVSAAKQTKPKMPKLAYDHEVRIIARHLDLNPNLIFALMRAESAFNPVAMSSVGARGIMQLMPYTALKIARLAGDEEFQPDQLGDPIRSIVYGSLYFKFLYDAFDQNSFVAIAAYNAGPQAVHQWLKGCRRCKADEFVELIPYQETRNYVKKVLNYFAEYQITRDDAKPFETLPTLPNPDNVPIEQLF
jgi:soluble lytic murein transglycosylase-like protein